MEKSRINNMDKKFLLDLGITEDDIEKVNSLVKEGIDKKLYTNSTIPYHSLSHAERVIIYSLLIFRALEQNGSIIDNKELLLKAALYHDCGRSWNLFGENHGIKGAKKAHILLQDKLDTKSLNIIELLIETHARKENKVDFKTYEFNKLEKENIQLLSNILKDADALDRNRIKLFKFAQCKTEFLRTKEAKDIYLKSKLLLEKYEEAK